PPPYEPPPPWPPTFVVGIANGDAELVTTGGLGPVGSGSPWSGDEYERGGCGVIPFPTLIILALLRVCVGTLLRGGETLRCGVGTLNCGRGMLTCGMLSCPALAALLDANANVPTIAK